MAGNTGKMTADAIAARGPRMRLIRIFSGVRLIGSVVMREPDSPIGLGITKLKDPWYKTVSRSYSLSYLLRIGAQ